MGTRDVGPFMAMMRAFLLGRNHQNNLRFRREMAPRYEDWSCHNWGLFSSKCINLNRSIPPADLPPGPSHKIAANYYFSRESRRGVDPPVVLAPQQVLLESPVAKAEERPKSKTPGPYYNHSTWSLEDGRFKGFIEISCNADTVVYWNRESNYYL